MSKAAIEISNRTVLLLLLFIIVAVIIIIIGIKFGDVGQQVGGEYLTTAEEFCPPTSPDCIP
jgi:hypothetical protein